MSDVEYQLERETTTPSGLVTMRHVIGADGRSAIHDIYYSRELQHIWQRAEGETLEAFKNRVEVAALPPAEADALLDWCDYPARRLHHHGLAFNLANSAVIR